MNKPVTAAELMAKLAADPEYVAMRERQDTEIAARVAEIRIAEAPLTEALLRCSKCIGGRCVSRLSRLAAE